MFGMGTGGSLRLLSPEIQGFVFGISPFSAPSKPHRLASASQLTMSLPLQLSKLLFSLLLCHYHKPLAFICSFDLIDLFDLTDLSDLS